jgi:hypothetical protein
VKKCKTGVAEQNYKYIPSQLISKLTGSAKQLVEMLGDDIVKFRVDTGVEDLLNYLKENLGTKDYQDDSKAIKDYFFKTRRDKGMTMQSYINVEQKNYNEYLARMKAAYDREQATAGTSGSAAHAAGVAQPYGLPDLTRGFLFLDRANLNRKEHPQIIMNAGGDTRYSKLKTILESYRDDDLRIIDRERKDHTTYCCCGCEIQDDYEQQDANATYDDEEMPNGFRKMNTWIAFLKFSLATLATQFLKTLRLARCTAPRTRSMRTASTMPTETILSTSKHLSVTRRHESFLRRLTWHVGITLLSYPCLDHLFVLPLASIRARVRARARRASGKEPRAVASL